MKADDYSGLDTRAIELLAKGNSVPWVAHALGITQAKVNRIRVEWFRAETSKREAMVANAAMTLDYVQRLCIEAIEEAKTKGQKWERKDVELVVKILERRSRLFGLDQPVKVETKAVEEFSDEQLYEEARRLGIQVTQPTPPALPPAAPVEEIVDAEVVAEEGSAVELRPEAGPSARREVLP